VIGNPVIGNNANRQTNSHADGRLPSAADLQTPIISRQFHSAPALPAVNERLIQLRKEFIP
jgi:hypothetical protein